MHSPGISSYSRRSCWSLLTECRRLTELPAAHTSPNSDPGDHPDEENGLGQRPQEQPHCRLHCCISVPARLDGTGACSVSSGLSHPGCFWRHRLLVRRGGPPRRFRGWGEDDGARRACGGATGRVVQGYSRFDERYGVSREESIRAIHGQRPVCDIRPLTL